MLTTKLVLKQISAVALCKQGANPVADIMLYKSKEGKRMTFAEFLKSLPEDQQALINAEIEKSKPTPEQIAALEEKKKLEGQLQEKDNTITELQKSLDAVKKSVKVDDEEEILKGADPKIVEMFKKAREAEVAAVAKAAALEEENVTKSYNEKAAIYKSLPLKSDELGKMLKSIGTKVDKDTFVSLESLLKAVNEGIEKSGLFEEFGKNNPAGNGTSAWDQIEVKADEIQKSAPEMSRAHAIAKAMKDNPALYKQYQTELKGDE